MPAGPATVTVTVARIHVSARPRVPKRPLDSIEADVGAVHRVALLARDLLKRIGSGLPGDQHVAVRMLIRSAHQTGRSNLPFLRCCRSRSFGGQDG
jgi:hypothetical protein